MDIKLVIQSQYFASLAMLKQAIVKCPSSAWDAREDKDKVWFKMKDWAAVKPLNLTGLNSDITR